MKRSLVLALACVLALALAVPATAAPGNGTGRRGNDRLDLYEVLMEPDQVEALRGLGLDEHEIPLGRPDAKGRVRSEVILSDAQANRLRGRGLKVGLMRNAQGMSSAEAATVQAASGFEVWRSFSEPGGLRDELRAVARANPAIVKLVVLGQSLQGQDIIALKVTKDANRVKDGARPSVLYAGTQHAREWISPEVTRRLLHHFVDGYGRDAELTRLVDTTELWFVPVANPDGYDWTFEPGQRQWRKNLRDNNGDGVITPGDGVDLNRNFPHNWGYDNEGSSPDPGSEVYRGAAPASEPETRALDGLMARIPFSFVVNYHSAAELILYGVGWQVATPSPDDHVQVALAGDDETPAIEGYDPDLSAELYTTNGDTTDHAHVVHRQLAFTPELATCATATTYDPADAYGPTYCQGRSVFEFPDSEALVQFEFSKNVPFALSMARSAADPANPVSAIGWEAPDMVADTFDVSHGASQTVAVEAKRELRNLRMVYRVNGGRPTSVRVDEWEGGERYGGRNDVWFAEYRGQVTGTREGDRVEVWFEGRKVPKPSTAVTGTRGPRDPSPQRPVDVSTEPFTYTVERASDADVLVIANEDYEGFSPQQPGVGAPLYTAAYTEAIAANGRRSEVWDVSAQGVPHDLGVLSHYDALVWETGDNRITQDADDVVNLPFGFTEVNVAERQQYLTIAVRDYLNEGGKLLQAGKWAGYHGVLDFVGGLYYGLNGDPEAPCSLTTSYFDDCLILSDDFHQYYLGNFQRTTFGAPAAVAGTAGTFDGLEVGLNGGEVRNQTTAGTLLATSEVLPVEEFPQFESWAIAQYARGDGPSGPSIPYSGEQAAGVRHSDGVWARLSRTADLRGASSAELAMQASHSIEADYDHLIVEARPVGSEQWTTLPERGGATSTAVPAECEAGYYLGMHPALQRYLTLANPCLPTGSSGAWNSISTTNGRWDRYAFDLSPYAGQQVEIVVSYVTDPFAGGTGVLVDDIELAIDGAREVEDFEASLGAWSVPGAPAGSPGNSTDWELTTGQRTAGVATDDTLMFGFGFEGVDSTAERAELMGAALDHLLP